MELGTVMSVVQTLCAALQCSELRQLFDLFGYKSELDDLRRTVSTVRAVLKDAEAKQDDLLSMSHQAQLFVDELKDAVYDADDLLDEFITVAELKRQHLIHNGATLGEIRLFFSRFNRLGFARKMNKSVGKIRKKLDGIALNYEKFGFKVDYEPIKVRREETCSYVSEGEIIGREVDVENLVAMLAHDDVGCRFVTVVGIGGLGKTALAQLVYNDERVKNEFSLRMWTCVSDQDSNVFGTKDILVKILKSATGGSFDNYTMDQVQIECQKQLGKHKYLLVLDDVWTEDREQWLKLERFLKFGKEGSWVVVTTRSKETARIVGNGVMYELQGLSLEHSWRLFEKTAFGEANPPKQFVEVGHQIVDRCANVPLAIRVVGSLLYGQTLKRWHSFRQKGLAYMNDDENEIKSILKLSYHHLKSPLKSCFSYCAIFPKDFVIKKRILIALWMAQGYVEPSLFSDGQSMDDVAEECFLILLRRCFFQDVEKDIYGEVVSCKMHDLMHDIAQDVAGKEICEVSSNTTRLDERVRHVLSLNEELMEKSPNTSRIRTCLWVGGKDKQLLMGLILANCARLRSLILSDVTFTVLPESIGTLLHLRYLDLSLNSKLQMLPKSITKLRNLLVLNLIKCGELKELPKDLSKLHKLHVLNIYGCDKLKYLPSGIVTLGCLHTLGRYMVGQERMDVNECFDQLEDLKGLGNLKGSIEIDIQVPKNAKYVKEDHRGGAYMGDKKHLKCIEFAFKHFENYESLEFEEALLEELQPHSNLMGLTLNGCKSVRLPSWVRKENLAKRLPNLVKLEVNNCEGLEYLPDLVRLIHLKELKLVDLPKLEYVENELPTVVPGHSQQLLSYPCLEEVHFQCLPKLKAWSRGAKVINDRDCLPRLKKMVIVECLELSSTLSPPFMEGLSVHDCKTLWKGRNFFAEIRKSLRGSRA
ncbi:hypothetical protein vseg_001195 [Gypsophila vaccaria]